MAKRMWVYDPKCAKPNIPKEDIITVKEKCEKFVQEKLAPKYIQPLDRKNKTEMQLTDIRIKTIGNKFLFIAVYKDFRSDVISEDYESKFARIIMLSNNRFCIDYMRHTGQWWDITDMVGSTLSECLKGIAQEPHFVIL